MQTVDTRIIAINRCRSHIISLLGCSILLQYLIWRFVVIRAHHSILITHHLLLLGLSLHIVRLRGGAAIGVRTSYDVRVELPLWIRASRHSTSATYLRRRRVSPHRHLYPTRIEISGSLIHKVLRHSHCRASTCRTHHCLLPIYRLLPRRLCVLEYLLLLLKHHSDIRLLLFLFGFLKFEGVSGCEIHEGDLYRVGGLPSDLARTSLSLAHRCRVGLDVVVVLSVLEVCGHLLLMMESSSIVSSEHMRYGMSLVRQVNNPFAGVILVPRGCPCQHLRQLV